MKKNNAVQTAPKHSMLTNQAPVPQKSKVSSQMTLSDSILSGAVVEFRKSGKSQYSYAAPAYEY